MNYHSRLVNIAMYFVLWFVLMNIENNLVFPSKELFTELLDLPYIIGIIFLRFYRNLFK